MKLLIASILVAASFAAQAQEATGSGYAIGSGTGGNIGSISVNTGSVVPGDTKAEVTHKGAGQYTAPSGPATYGAVGNNGCPVLETKSGAVFVANYAQAVAREMPGCMGLLLFNALGQINPNAEGVITFKEYAGLQALCDFPQYRDRLNTIGYIYNGFQFKCAQVAQQ